MKTVYQTDDNNVLAYAFDIPPQHDIGYVLPYGAVDVTPPELPAGRCARWRTELPRVGAAYGAAGSGDWVSEEDHRETALFRTANGAAYEVGTLADGLCYAGVGPLPAWLTAQPYPGVFHIWRDGAWVVDADARDQAAAAAERAWRDGEIARITWLRDRHRDEMEAGSQSTSLTAAQYVQLQTYIQALRDWPANPSFPSASTRPAAPDWLAGALA